MKKNYLSPDFDIVFFATDYSVMTESGYTDPDPEFPGEGDDLEAALDNPEDALDNPKF